MNSVDLAGQGFARWLPFNRATEAQLVETAPSGWGVYVIRRSSAFNRVRGTSDILYIGSAMNQGGLRNRLRQYFHPGPTQSTNKRLLALCGDCEDYEVSFVEHDRPKALESDLLAQYEDEHGERPPENRRR